MAAAFKQDGTGTYALTKRSGNGGYTNNPQTNQMSPITGKVLVVKTNDGGLCKNRNCKLLQREWCFQPSKRRYDTFNYVYNPNLRDNNLE